MVMNGVGKCKTIVHRNVASFAEAYKRRKEFMTELNNQIRYYLKQIHKKKNALP